MTKKKLESITGPRYEAKGANNAMPNTIYQSPGGYWPTLREIFRPESIEVTDGLRNRLGYLEQTGDREENEKDEKKIKYKYLRDLLRLLATVRSEPRPPGKRPRLRRRNEKKKKKFVSL